MGKLFLVLGKEEIGTCLQDCVNGMGYGGYKTIEYA
jgi:hypothetical protein